MADVTLRNVSVVGALDIPIARASVPAGGTFQVSEQVADLLLRQPDNFVRVDPDPAAGTNSEEAAS